jgi:hypothetical protein
MIIRCDTCGGPMNHKFQKNRDESYKCLDRSCCEIDRKGVDRLLIGTAAEPGAILLYLLSDKAYADFCATPQQEARAQAVRSDLQRLRTERRTMEAAEPESLTESRVIARGLEGLERRITALEAEERTLTLPAVLQDLITPGKGVEARWAAAPISARREVERLLLTHGVLGEVRVTPCPDKRRRPAMKRIRFAQAA